MNNYNFTQQLDGLNNIEASNINTENLNVGSLVVDTAEITTLSDSNLVNCTTSTNPTQNDSLVRKDYVDLNFVDKTTTQIISGVKNFTNNTQFRATLTYFDTQTPFSNNSQFFHIGVTSVIKNNANSGIITYNTRTSAGVASNVMEISSSFLRMFKPIRIIDTNSPLTGYTEILQAGTLLSFTPSYNLGEYQFKTRTSTGTTNIPLIIDNDGISVFGTTSCAVMESSAYRGTSATADLAIGGTTTSGTILIGTVINGTLGGEIRIGTTLSTNNINGTTTFSNNCNFNSILTLKNKKQLNETQNIQTATTITLSFPLQETTVIRSSGGATTITVVLPTVTVNEVGLIFNFFKFQNGLNVILQSASRIYTLNDLGTGYTTNTTLLSSDKLMTTLMCNSFGTLYYWVEVNNYSTFDRDYNNTIYARLASPNAFTNTNTFNSFLPTSTLTPSSPTELTTKAYVDGMPVHQILNTNNIWTGQNSFNTYLPTSTLTPSGSTDLITKNYADGKFIDFTTDQTISALQKRFNGIFCTSFNITPTLGGTGNRQQLYVTGQELAFVPQFTNNYYRFYCKDSLSNQTNPFEISSATTIVRNNFISDAQATFNNICPISNTNASSNNHLTTLGFNDGRYVDKTTSQTIYGNKYFGNRVQLYGGIALEVGTGSSTFAGNVELNAQSTFNNFAPISNTNATLAQHLVRKDYCDSNFMYKTGSINENITGEKTFQNSAFFTGSNGYFMINANMSGGTFNPASTTGTIGIIGLKDQTNDNFLLTLYGSIHASVKLNFTSGVSMGFGGGSQIPNTQVLCNGTNVVIKPSLQFSGDSTIQNSAFTGAGSLNGTYNLANMTIDTNGKITSLSSGLSSNNNFTGTNTFIGDLVAKTNIKLYDSTSSTRYSNFYMYLNEFIFTTVGGTNTALSFSLNDNVGSQYEAMRITNNLITFATSNIFLSNTGDTIIDSASTTGVSLFNTISNGVISMFSSLSNSIVTMFNSSTNDVTLDINAKVKFRQVKLYNQVKTITGNITLSFPLEETVVIRPTGVVYIELPLITANSLGMSFNFITNSTAYAIWFSTQGTDNIIKNGYTTGNSSQIILGSIGITSCQMTCLELTAGVYSWSFLSSLPEKISNPPGTIITMAVQSTPLGYLACDGGSYSFGGIYSNLYQVIGTTYGSSGVGTFKVPNFNNGSFLRGVGGNSGSIATQQQDNIRTHTHNTTFYRFDKGSSGGTNVISDLSTGSVGSTVVLSSVNTAGSPDETRPINYSVFYCIKY